MYKLVAIGEHTKGVLFLESSVSREFLMERALKHARDLEDQFPDAVAFATDSGAIALGRTDDRTLHTNTRFEVWEAIDR